MDLTTLAYVQGYMQDTSAATAAALPALITAASAFVEQFCSRTFAIASYDEWYDGSGNAKLMLASLPIVSVSAVSICGGNIPVSAGPNSPGYVVDPKAGLVLRCQYFAKGTLNTRVTYSAGFSSTSAGMPDDLQECIAIMCNIRIKRVANEDKSSINMMHQSTVFVASELTPYVKQILQQYKPPFRAYGVPA